MISFYTISIYNGQHCKSNTMNMQYFAASAQTTNANGFGTMSVITIMFVAPLSSDNRHRSSLLLLLLLDLNEQEKML